MSCPPQTAPQLSDVLAPLPRPPNLAVQAFAQVMLLQQETIASLMGMLEDAKSEAAATLAPITRPPSPTKRAALQGVQQAQARVLQDR